MNNNNQQQPVKIKKPLKFKSGGAKIVGTPQKFK